MFNSSFNSCYLYDSSTLLQFAHKGFQMKLCVMLWLHVIYIILQVLLIDGLWCGAVIMLFMWLIYIIDHYFILLRPGSDISFRYFFMFSCCPWGYTNFSLINLSNIFFRTTTCSYTKEDGALCHNDERQQIYLIIELNLICNMELFLAVLILSCLNSFVAPDAQGIHFFLFLLYQITKVITLCCILFILVLF